MHYRILAIMAVAASICVSGCTRKIEEKPTQQSGNYEPKPELVAEVEAAVRDNVDAFNVPEGTTFDIDRVMKLYAEGDDFLMYDFMVPQEWTGHGLREHFQDVMAHYAGKIDVEDIRVHVDGTVAFATSIQRAYGTSKEGKAFDTRFRVTDGLVKKNGKWIWVHQHVSLPINWTTGQAVVNAQKDDPRPRSP